MASNIKLGSPVYVAHSETERAAFTSEFVSAGFKLSGVIIWKKNTLVMGRSDYQWMHEPILYGWLDGAAHAWYGGRRRTTVQEIMSSTGMEPLDGGKRYLIMTADRAFTVDADAVAEEVETTIILEKKPNVSKDHPTMKPVALIERMLVNSARRGDIVLDPFGGSGSTLIAAERLGLRARLIELDPIYCDTIVKRWEDYTGKTANVRRAG
ncbi:MAG: DNA methyltransferase [Opitutaceae bacterium]